MKGLEIRDISPKPSQEREGKDLQGDADVVLHTATASYQPHDKAAKQDCRESAHFGTRCRCNSAVWRYVHRHTRGGIAEKASQEASLSQRRIATA